MLSECSKDCSLDIRWISANSSVSSRVSFAASFDGILNSLRRCLVYIRCEDVDFSIYKAKYSMHTMHDIFIGFLFK